MERGGGKAALEYGLPAWGGSSAGRAPRSQCGGREFDPPPLHNKSLFHAACGPFLFPHPRMNPNQDLHFFGAVRIGQNSISHVPWLP